MRHFLIFQIMIIVITIIILLTRNTPVNVIHFTVFPLFLFRYLFYCSFFSFVFFACVSMFYVVAFESFLFFFFLPPTVVLLVFL